MVVTRQTAVMRVRTKAVMRQTALMKGRTKAVMRQTDVTKAVMKQIALMKGRMKAGMRHLPRWMVFWLAVRMLLRRERRERKIDISWP